MHAYRDTRIQMLYVDERFFGFLLQLLPKKKKKKKTNVKEFFTTASVYLIISIDLIKNLLQLSLWSYFLVSSGSLFLISLFTSIYFFLSFHSCATCSVLTCFFFLNKTYYHLVSCYHTIRFLALLSGLGGSHFCVVAKGKRVTNRILTCA